MYAAQTSKEEREKRSRRQETRESQLSHLQQEIGWPGSPSMVAQINHDDSLNQLICKFVGLVIARAMNDNKLLECYFTRSVYKHILGKCVRYSDMDSEDYSFYQVTPLINNCTLVS